MNCCWSGKFPENLAMATDSDRWWSQEDWLYLPTKFEPSGVQPYTPRQRQAGWLSGIPAWINEAQQADYKQLSTNTFRALSSGLGRLAFAGDKMRRWHRLTDGLVHALEYWTCRPSHNQGGLVDIVAVGVDPSYDGAEQIEGRWDLVPDWNPEENAWDAATKFFGGVSAAKSLRSEYENATMSYPFWLRWKTTQVWVNSTSWGGEFGMDAFGMSGGAALHIDFKIRRLANRSLFGNPPLFVVFIPMEIWQDNLDSLGDLDEILIAVAANTFTVIRPSAIHQVLPDATMEKYMDVFKPGSYGVPTLSINQEPVALTVADNDNDRIRQAQKIGQLLQFVPPQQWASPDGFIGKGYPAGYGGWQAAVSDNLGGFSDEDSE